MSSESEISDGSTFPLPGWRYRNVERTDLPEIAKLVRCQTLSTYHSAEHPNIIFEKACLSIVQENEEREIISSVFYCNYPNVPVLAKSAWPVWIRNLYNLEKSTEANTLFVHFLVWDARYEEFCLKELLKATYYTLEQCHYIVIVQPPGVEAADAIRETMTRHVAQNVSEENETQVLYVGYERQLIPEVKTRLAVEEDNDDVVTILDAEAPFIHAFYGDFYVSEIMRHPFKTRRIVVAERLNKVIACLCVNRGLDLELLDDVFDLAAFGHLRKFSKIASSDEGAYEEEEWEAPASAETLRMIIESKSSEFFEYNESCESLVCYRRRKRASSVSPPEPNVFVLELLGTRHCTDEARTRPLLDAGYECFPDLEYCIVLLPTDRPHYPFLDNFVRVPVKMNRDFPMALYLTHRSLLRGVLKVRTFRVSDLENTMRFLQELTCGEDIQRDLQDSLRADKRCTGYVFTCDDVLVGLAVICPEEEIVKLRRCYSLEELAPKSLPDEERFAKMLQFTIMPIFAPKMGFFLGEIMRQSGFSVLLYMLLANLPADTVSPCVGVMQMAQPRLRNWPPFQQYYKMKHENLPFDKLFSLYVVTPRLMMLGREIINTKIVVVGASDTGLSFLDALTLGPKFTDLLFTDITLVSTNGKRYKHSTEFLARISTPFRGRYCHSYRDLTSGRLHYNVVRGKIVEIDRKNRTLLLDTLQKLKYDYLVLTCGLTFAKPKLKGRTKNYLIPQPLNCYIINDDFDAESSIKDIKRMTNNLKKKKSIVFHGSNIECYCALGVFFEVGLPGSWITLISPKIPPTKDIFSTDPNIKAELSEYIQKNGVRVVPDSVLMDWSYADAGILNSLLIETPDGPLTIECDALISFQYRIPDSKCFLAISKAGLVFDGKLVIDGEYRTNDPHVFAAGTMTKYSKKLRMPLLKHSNYNSFENGEKFAEKLMEILMAERTGMEVYRIPNKQPKPPNITYRRPIIVAAILPGGYRYLRVRRPGMKKLQDIDEFTKAERRGDVLTTGSCLGDTGYFRLRLNQFHTVDGITCCSKQDFELQNIIALFGKHDHLLNSVKARFQNGEISDLFAYFQQPWAAALYADDFDDCRANWRGVLAQDMQKAQARGEMNTWFCDEVVADILQKNEYLEETKEGLIDYLEQREYELPMYSTPCKERQIRREIEDRPLLKESVGSC